MMLFKLKHSKITGMQGRKQQGMASIVVVSVLIIIMTLISIGFARLVNRSAVNSANKQFSASATYAAQSAINDVASYLKQYADANPGSNFLPKSTKCNGAGSLIGDSTSPGPFFNDSNLSGDTNRSTQYTCLLLNPTPDNLSYQVAATKSQVIKVNTSASTGALDKLLISWQPSCNPSTVPSCPTGYPVSTSNLDDTTTWNSVGSNCKDTANANASCVPMLRLAIYPISNSSQLSDVQAKAKTVYLYPQKPSGTVPSKSFTDAAGFKDGSLIPVACTQTIGANDFNPSTDTGYKCNIIIRSLSTAIAPANTDSVYLRMTPIYNQADIRIAADDKFGNSLTFIHDQAVIDATAQTGGVVKRLQARVDTSSLDSNSSSIDTNISSLSDTFPEQAVRTANALCKREVLTTSSVDFSQFVNFDAPDGVCHTETTTVTNPVPQLQLTITGRDGQDNNRTVDSEANNPDGGQNPVERGTVYVGSSPTSSGTARIDWTSIDADSCTATGGSGGWAGEKNGMMSFSGSPSITGNGSQTFSVSSVTSYTLYCSRPFAPAPTPTKTVTIWPYPIITGLSVNPSQINAGNNYTISWSSRNTVRCSLNGPWNNPSPNSSATSGSDTENWPWNDNSSTRTYRVTCYDPAGRSDSSVITVSPGGNSCSGNGCSSSSGGHINPPTCSTPSVSIHDNGNGTGYPTWSGSCPDVSPGSGYYYLYSSTDSSWNGLWVANSGNATWLQVGSGYHCVGLREGVDPWGWRADSGETCKTIVPPLTITNFSGSGLWDQGPECNATSGLNNTWWCRGNASRINPSPPDCADGVHRWTICSISWSTSGGGGTVDCKASTGYGTFDSSSWPAGGINSHRGGAWGWSDGGKPSFTLSCTDSYGQIAGASRNF